MRRYEYKAIAEALAEVTETDGGAAAVGVANALIGLNPKGFRIEAFLETAGVPAECIDVAGGFTLPTVTLTQDANGFKADADEAEEDDDFFATFDEAVAATTQAAVDAGVEDEAFGVIRVIVF